MVPRALVALLFLATVPWFVPASAESNPVDMAAGGGAGVPAGAFGTLLRTYQEATGGLHYDLLRLLAGEDYDNYYFQVEAAPGASPDAAAAFVRVRRIGTQDYICQGVAAEALNTPVLRDCDDLVVLHHFEVEWMVDNPASVMRLKGY